MASRLKKLRQQEARQLASGEVRAGGLETRADEARATFDAAAAAREVAKAQFKDFQEELGKGIESLRGHQVGRGRLDTGFGMEDEDRLVMDFQDRLSRDVAKGAFTAASLNLRNIEGETGAAESARDRNLDLLTGATDRAQAIENDKQRRKRGRFGLLGGAIGGVGGFFLGGPAGAMAGAKAGSAIASGI